MQLLKTLDLRVEKDCHALIEFVTTRGKEISLSKEHIAIPLQVFDSKIEKELLDRYSNYFYYLENTGSFTSIISRVLSDTDWQMLNNQSVSATDYDIVLAHTEFLSLEKGYLEIILGDNKTVEASLIVIKTVMLQNKQNKQLRLFTLLHLAVKPKVFDDSATLDFSGTLYELVIKEGDFDKVLEILESTKKIQEDYCLDYPSATLAGADLTTFYSAINSYLVYSEAHRARETNQLV